MKKQKYQGNNIRVPELKKMKLLVLKSQPNPNIMNEERFFPRIIIVKFNNTKDAEKILKASESKSKSSIIDQESESYENS